MIRYRVIIPPELQDPLSRLPPNVKQKVRASFRLLEQDPLAGKSLERELKGFRSYAIPPYRIVYKIDASHRIVGVKGVGHRRDIYDIFLQKLNSGEIRERRAIYIRK